MPIVLPINLLLCMFGYDAQKDADMLEDIRKESLKRN